MFWGLLCFRPQQNGRQSLRPAWNFKQTFYYKFNRGCGTLVGPKKSVSDRFPRKLHCRQRVVCFQVQSGFIRRYWWRLIHYVNQRNCQPFFFFFWRWICERKDVVQISWEKKFVQIVSQTEKKPAKNCFSRVFENSGFLFLVFSCELTLTQVTSTKTSEILSLQYGKW